MIDYLQAFWLAVLQGITEFLPISSSGHLILVPKLLGWPDQGIAFDVAVHIGSLIAVVAYFRSDIVLILRHWLRSLMGGPSTPHSRLAWAICFATIMIGSVGLLIEPLIDIWMRSPLLVATTTIIFGLILWWADRRGAKKRTIEQIHWRDVVIIGGAQILAMIPGTSRSGITISAGLAMGLNREAAARFSFLMAIPVIIMIGLWQSHRLIASPEPVQWNILLFGTIISALVAFICIHWFLRFLNRFGMLPFVIYRILLGLFLFAVFL